MKRLRDGWPVLALLVLALMFFFGLQFQQPGQAQDCCKACKICKQCQANAKALQFPPREGWHLVYPVSAIDGDTVLIWWIVKDYARLNGINAPELRDAGGPEAKAYLQNLLPKKAIPALVHGRDKYGRTLLDLYPTPDKSASEAIIKAGHAKPWDGRGERP